MVPSGRGLAMPRYEYECDSCGYTPSQKIAANDYAGATLDGSKCWHCLPGHLKRVYTPFTFRMS